MNDRTIGFAEKTCTVKNVKSKKGTPPVWVKFSDGHAAFPRFEYSGGTR